MSDPALQRPSGGLGRRLCGALALALVLGAAGCMTMGPGVVARDRFDYAEALNKSWREQMLVNLVKVRYGEPPMFLDISSVINSYSLETDVAVGAGFSHPLSINGNTLSVGASSRYTDRPTVTYQPLVGDRFRKSLMTAIPPEALASLIQSGWHSEFLLRCCVHAINHLRNYAGGAQMYRRQADPAFVELAGVLDRLQRNGILGLGVGRARGPGDGVGSDKGGTGKAGGDNKDGHATMLYFAESSDPGVAADIAAFRRLLRLDATVDEYRIGYGAVPKSRGEIVILTRSILEVLLDLSSYIDVPAEDIATGRARSGFDAVGAGTGAGFRPLFKVHSGVERPADTYASIRHRDHWFWIDDGDYHSKGVFSFLMFIYTLSETGGGQLAPLVTIPAG